MRKIIVIGLGSMGIRRIRLMSSMAQKPEIIGVDVSQERRESARNGFGIEVAESIKEAVASFNPSVAFICTSPLSHGSIVMECLTLGLHVFTEINLLSDWYDDAIALANRNRLQMFISSTFLYRREIEFLSSTISNDTVDYIYHSGQYLPDWHPWESYKDFFVSDKRTNACREIMAIEFPWIIHVFGEVETLSVLSGKNSSLDVDFNDNYIISVRHKNGNKGVFCQDILSRKGLRRLEVYSERQHIFWEGTPESLAIYDLKSSTIVPVSLYEDVEHQKGYNSNIVENAYREEIFEFFACLDGQRTPRYSFVKDKEILYMIDGIERGTYGR